MRVTIVTAQLRGFDRVGGVGTGTTFLALGLARAGHTVNLLYIGHAHRDAGDEWSRLYERAGVGIATLAPDEAVEPRRFVRISAVERALRDDAPDAVIAHDFGAPAYAAQRLRALGLGFADTLFVVFCHGTRRWVKEVTRNPLASADVMLESSLERASVELADVVVSPSAFMIEWMRGQGWSLPETSRVIPYLTRSAALGEAVPERSGGNDGPVERLTYFGQREEIKGVGPFIAGLNALEPALLRSVELEFLGAETKQWTRERVESSLTQRTRAISFVSDLDQQEALERLSRPGTLAVMPSLADNSPNTVYECLERGIPFLASDSGGIAELVAPEDRARVVFEPTASGVADALRRALSAPGALRPARPAFDGAASLAAWSDLVELRPAVAAPSAASPDVDIVVTVSDWSPNQTYRKTRVVRAETRAAGLDAATADWVVCLEPGDEPDPELVETLVRAQAASGADVVTCAVRTDAGTWYFAGEPAGVGVLANHYGTVGLVRRSLLDQVDEPWLARGDPDWPLLARLSAAGAEIVSVPRPLVTRTDEPGTLEHDPSEGLLVVEHVERELPREVRSLARLAAGLAADAGRFKSPG